MSDASAASASAWALAEIAAGLFAIDPVGTGICIRARSGPQLDRWLAILRGFIGERALRKIPPAIADDRLLGGLDLATTLAAGRPVAERGILAESDGGVVLIPSAERMPAALAARIASTHDRGEVRLERDRLVLESPARFGLVLIDEAVDDSEGPPAALLDRIAFGADLSSVALADIGCANLAQADVARARACLSNVSIDDGAIRQLCEVSSALGIRSARAPLLALRAAKAAAALHGRATVSDEDLALAAQLVFAWRATEMPSVEPEKRPADDAPPPEPHGEASENGLPPADDKERADLILAAVRAALPPDLLAQLMENRVRGNRHGASGRTGAMRKSGHRGKPSGITRADPRGGVRLNLVATLRAAAPWQTIRRRAAAHLTQEESSRRRPMGKIEIRRADFRMIRYAERRETLTIFAVDASGSLAYSRLAEAKGAVEQLLADCYVRRDQVALIAFRNRCADLLLPPTRSLVRAKRCLSSLIGGGSTPLANGIDAACSLALSGMRRGQSALIVLLTDGRANIARTGEPGRALAGEDALVSGRLLAARSIKSLLIDTSPRPEPRAQDLAAAMDAVYLALPHIDAHLISHAVKGLRSTVFDHV